MERRQLAEGERVLTAKVEDPPPEVDRVELTVEALRRELRHPLVAAGHLLVGVGRVDHPLVVVVEVRPALVVEVERLEALQTDPAVRVELQDLVVGRDRVLRAAEVAVVGAGETGVEIDQDLRVHRVLDPLLQDLHQLVPHRRLAVDAVEGGERLLVVGVVAPDSDVGVDRPRRVLEVLVEHATRAGEDREADLVGHPLDLEDLVADVDDVGPLLSDLRQAGHLFGDLRVERVVHVGAEPPVEGLSSVTEATLADLRDVLDDAHPVDRVGGHAELHLAELHQRVPTLRRVVERLEDLGDLLLMLALGEDQLEGAERGRVVRVDVQDLAVDLDGMRQVAHVHLVDLGHPELALDRLVLVV